MPGTLRQASASRTTANAWMSDAMRIERGSSLLRDSFASRAIMRQASAAAVDHRDGYAEQFSSEYAADVPWHSSSSPNGTVAAIARNCVSFGVENHG